MMTEKSTHKKVKSQVAGKTGSKEVTIKGGRRLDVMIRGRPVPCSVVEMPFYEAEKSNRR